MQEIEQGFVVADPTFLLTKAVELGAFQQPMPTPRCRLRLVFGQQLA
jgi:hypothetical protein